LCSQLTGPHTSPIEASPNVLPKYIGLLSIGAEVEIIEIIPINKPAPPTPAIALPMMSTVEDWATPQSRDPSSNVLRQPRKTIWL